MRSCLWRPCFRCLTLANILSAIDDNGNDTYAKPKRFSQKDSADSRCSFREQNVFAFTTMRSRLSSSIALSFTRILDVDAFENHGKFRGGKFDATIDGGRRDAEVARLKTLVPNRVTVAVPIDHLQKRLASIGEHEQIAGQRVVAPCVLDDGR